jgi:mono/diheme cytochrome c family protein
VLAAGLFVSFWLVLGLGVFFIALRGGGRGARGPTRESAAARSFSSFLFVVIYAGFGLAIPIVLLAGNHANASTQWNGVRLTAAQKEGRALFGQHCMYCHTLAAANAVGKVGPNLDVLQAPKSLVLSTVQNGLNIGNGVMPAGIVVGRQAVDVSDFVSAVAGK